MMGTSSDEESENYLFTVESDLFDATTEEVAKQSQHRFLIFFFLLSSVIFPQFLFFFFTDKNFTPLIIIFALLRLLSHTQWISFISNCSCIFLCSSQLNSTDSQKMIYKTSQKSDL
jgi:fatty-acid desaturase